MNLYSSPLTMGLMRWEAHFWRVPHPRQCNVSAGVFGMLKQGFAAIAATMGVPRSVSLFLLGLAIVVLGAFRYRKLAQREVDS